MASKHQKLIEQRDTPQQPLMYVVVCVNGRDASKRVELVHGHKSITEAEDCARCHLQYQSIKAEWDENEETREVRYDIEPDPQHDGLQRGPVGPEDRGEGQP